MSKNTYPLRLPASVKKAVAELAAKMTGIAEPIHRGCRSGKGRYLNEDVHQFAQLFTMGFNSEEPGKRYLRG